VTFRIGGVLADMTSVKLSDEAGTYGVKRMDTGAIVVADGADMTRVSTGVYEYEFTDPAYNLTYDYCVEYVYLGDTRWDQDTLTGPTSAAAGPADSNLAVVYEDLVAEVAYFLGFGRKASTELDAQQLALVDVKVQAGYHQFLFPPKLPQDPTVHIWSFLNPNATLSVVAADYDYDLPNDFGGVIGEFNYAAGMARPPIPIVGEGQVMAARARANLSSYPKVAAIRPKPPTGTAEQHYEVLFYPTPDASYVLSYRYNVLTNRLTTSAPRAVGGMRHRQTLIESCLAQAEGGNDEEGVHFRAFLRALESSIAYDRSMMAPQTLGYNGDPGDAVGSIQRTGRVTYNGVLWD
jgi:hypothetical protein